MTVDRYVVVPKHVTDIVLKVLNQSKVSLTDHRYSPRLPFGNRGCRAMRMTPRAEQETQGSPVAAADTRPPAAFFALVTKLARSKCNAKVQTWTDKTARQHLSIARLFVKCAGTDDLRAMPQADVGAYLSLLSTLPTH